ncbi:glycoside hydrolase family 97 protein [Candidatus Saccharibacteria bacterium]|nr:glycoside hydrolase family 97 protein [Candidatus Saccharibacteria bacterium]
MWAKILGLFRSKNASANQVVSPDRRLVLAWELRNGVLYYTVTKDGRSLIAPSRVGFELQNDRPIASDLQVNRTLTKSSNEKWETVWGEEKEITSNYNELTLYISEKNGAQRLFTVRCRAFNDGVAWRYEIPSQPNLHKFKITNEVTEYSVDLNSTVWWIPAFQPDRYEYNYEKSKLLELGETSQSVHTPLTMRLPTGHYISLHEAALYNYGSMTLKLSNGRLVSDITPLSDGTRAHLETPWVSPWRTVVVAHTVTDLLASRMMLNLNEPNLLPNTDWIHPTKYMGIWWSLHLGEETWSQGDRHGATTENAKRYIDACRKFGIPALLIEGWNVGWDGDWVNHGENFRFTEAYPDFNLSEVVTYGKQNGVELVAHHETSGDVKNYEAQMDAAYAFLAQHGIRYLKTGYVGSRMNREQFHHSQYGVLHYQRTVELAAKHKIMLDIHEPIKGTGIERTYPNLMTREGARGEEYEGGGIDPSHTVIIPFTRGLSGGFDFTPGLFDITNYTKRVASTLARQLAYYVTIYSPWQMVADRPHMYENQPAFKFIHDVPTDWAQSKYLLGEIGEYLVTARQDRNSQDWYVGGLTNDSPRKLNLGLDFLPGDATWIAEIYRDSPDAHFRDHPLGINIESREVRSTDRFEMYLAPGGGFAIRLTPKKASPIPPTV